MKTKDSQITFSTAFNNANGAISAFASAVSCVGVGINEIADAAISEEEITELYNRYVAKHGKKMGTILLKAMGVDKLKTLNTSQRARLSEAVEESLDEEEHLTIFGESGKRDLDI